MTFIENLKEIADAYPDRVAVCHNHNEYLMTYKMLWEYSGRVYSYLKKHNIGRENFVMVKMPRDSRTYACAIGILRAGAAFCVTEDNYPRERIEYIINDLKIKLLLDEKLYDEMMLEDALEGYETADPHDAAFAVYTSGTTGTPKGVLHEIGNVNLIIDYYKSKKTERGERYACILPFNFVAFVIEMTSQLSCGNTVFILDNDIAKNLNKYTEFIKDEQIEALHIPPSMLRRLKEIPPSVLKIIIGTEPANGLYFDNIQLINRYAQSESCFVVAEMVLDKAYDKAPVGKTPIGIDIKILDENGDEVEDGITGEICFRNEFFRGYINLDKMTEKVFRGGIYHTGDLGYKNQDGNLVLSGRSDDMIKINGNRIEPAEIEAAGKRVLGVNQAIAKGFLEDDGRSFVALYYVLNEGQDKLNREDEVKYIKQIAEILPAYMVPAYLIEIDRIPTVPNGKADRKALPKPDMSNYRTSYEEPQGDIEKKLCKAIESILNIDKVGRNDDFYMLGGDSLKSMELVTLIDLPDFSTNEIFKGRTISKIAKLYNEKNAGAVDWESENERLKANEYPLTFEMRRFLSLELANPGTTMSVNRNAVRFPIKEIDADRFCAAINKVTHHYSIFGTVIIVNHNLEFVQKYDEKKIKPVSIVKLKESEVKDYLKSTLKHFNMINETFYDLHLIQTQEYLYFLNQNHHIVFDGSCNILLLEAIFNAYNDMPLRADTYYLYLDRCFYNNTDEFKAELDDYYKANLCNKDYKRNINPAADTKSKLMDVLVEIPHKFTVGDLQEAAKRLLGTPGVVAFASVLLAMSRVTNHKAVLALMQYSGRNDKLSDNTMGLLARSVPVAVDLDAISDVNNLIEELKLKVTNGMVYDCIEKLIGNNTPNDPECLTYVYEGQLAGIGKLEELNGEKLDLELLVDAPRDFSVIFEENGDALFSYTAFMKDYYDNEQSKVFHDAYVDILRELVSNKASGNIMVKDLI